MTESSYNRLIEVLKNSSDFNKNVPFSKVVDNTYAYAI